MLTSLWGATDSSMGLWDQSSLSDAAVGISSSSKVLNEMSPQLTVEGQRLASVFVTSFYIAWQQWRVKALVWPLITKDNGNTVVGALMFY